MLKFLRSSWGLVASLSPNRVVVVLTVVANVAGALVPVVSDVGFPSLIAPLAGINAVALMFLKGWHQFEQAMYDAEQVQFAHAAQAEARAAATAPRSAASKLNLPR